MHNSLQEKTLGTMQFLQGSAYWDGWDNIKLLLPPLNRRKMDGYGLNSVLP